MTPYYDSTPIFGYAVVIRHQPQITANQITTFFGLSGNMALFGGGRGRGFLITGVLPGDSPAGCVAVENLMLSYADGIARTLVDTVGITWPNVVFHGDYQRTASQQYMPFEAGWILPYKAVFIGLT
jgi:hypothetical protein